MIVSIPTKLDNDHIAIMKLTQDMKGNSVLLDQEQELTGWNAKQAQCAMDLLLMQGMAWLDEYKGEKLYWFPR